MSIGETQGDEAASDTDSGRKAGWFMLVGAAVLAAASFAVSVYSGDGSAPQARSAPDGPATLEELRAAAESSESDANLWGRLGAAYFQRHEFSQSVAAFERAVAIDASSTKLWTALGEARMLAANTPASETVPVPDTALEAFQRAIAIDPENPRPRFFVNVRKDLDGDHEGAIAGWLDLLSDTPPGSPWESDLVQTIQQVAAAHEIAVQDRLEAALRSRAPLANYAAAEGPLRGPSEEQVAQAGQMSRGEQQDMIAAMVQSLETRLNSDPDDVEGWIMLMRSRMTLGETEKAREALEKAVAANPGNAGRLRREAAQLGIE